LGNAVLFFKFVNYVGVSCFFIFAHAIYFFIKRSTSDLFHQRFPIDAAGIFEFY